jgi:signal transduction histidine kinase
MDTLNTEWGVSAGQRTASDRLARLEAVSLSLARALVPADVGRVLVDEAALSLDATLALFFERREPDGRLALVAHHGLARDALALARSASTEADLPFAAAARDDGAIWVDSAAAVAACPAWIRGRAGALAAIPLSHDGRVLGVVVIGLAAGRRFDDGDRAFLLTMTHQAAQTLARARIWRAHEDLHRREIERARFLAEASAVLASSLDLDATLEHLARVAVPRLGTGVEVDLLAENGALELAACVHVRPEVATNLRALRRLVEIPADHILRAAIRTGQVVIAPDVPDEILLQGLTSDEHRRWVRDVGLRSLMALPLVARGRTVGAITFATDAPGWPEDDVSLARDLASRAALAIDNARLYADAQQAVRVRDDFLSVASHELNTPLTSLQLALAQLARSRPDDDPSARMADTAARQAERLSKLVAQLLDVSRVTTGRLQLEPEPVDLRDVIEDVVGRLAIEARRAGSSLEVEVGGDVRGVWDRLRLEQVVTNLLANAVKFGRGHPVQVQVTRAGARVRLAVRDWGIGIAQQDRARIFERFERAVATHHYGGFGLGLWIVRQIVDAMGGTVEVESRPGEGSTFTVELPRAMMPS